LAAKFVTHRVVNVEAVARTFKPLWRAEKGFSVKDMGENTLLFTFAEETDLERVLSTEPWTYDKYVILFQRVDDDESVASVTFSTMPIWVQIHGLPLRNLSSEVAMDLGASLGQVEPYSMAGDERSGENNPRVRVRLDITKPLCRGRKVQLGKGKLGWLTFKYERLPNFCYVCGLLTHGEKDCGMRMKTRGDDPHAPPQYGPWLRAEPEKFQRKSFVTVEGRRNPFKPVHPQPEKRHSSETAPPHNTRPPNEITTDMETEDSGEIPSVDPQIPETNKDDFEKQLHEIDLAINQFHNPCTDSQHVNPEIEFFPSATTQTPLAPPILHNLTTPPISPNQRALGDITNTVESGKKTLTQASWRRVTRQKNSIQSPLINCQSKRAGGPLEVDTEPGRKRIELFLVDDNIETKSVEAAR
jgi:hypothetical protein